MNRGQLRDYITVQRFEREESDFENAAGEWIDILDSWSKYEPARVIPTPRDQAVTHVANAVFVAEEVSEVQESDRVLWGNRTFEVAGVRERDAVGQWFEIEVKEIRQSSSIVLGGLATIAGSTLATVDGNQLAEVEAIEVVLGSISTIAGEELVTVSGDQLAEVEVA